MSIRKAPAKVPFQIIDAWIKLQQFHQLILNLVDAYDKIWSAKLESVEVQMKAGRLLIKNFDARIPKIEIKPKGTSSKIVVHSKMYNEHDDKEINVKINFDDVAAIEFRINYFDNMIGAEALGLYEIEDIDFVNSVVKRNFGRRREIYLLEGDYEYDPNEPTDMLNVFDLLGTYQKEKETYHAFVQNVDAGVYIIIAKGYQIVR